MSRHPLSPQEPRLSLLTRKRFAPITRRAAWRHHEISRTLQDLWRELDDEGLTFDEIDDGVAAARDALEQLADAELGGAYAAWIAGRAAWGTKGITLPRPWIVDICLDDDGRIEERYVRRMEPSD